MQRRRVIFAILALIVAGGAMGRNLSIASVQTGKDANMTFFQNSERWFKGEAPGIKNNLLSN